MGYSDALVEIGDDAIRLKSYYFPFGSKRVSFAEIAEVVVEKPTLINGRWRIWGLRESSHMVPSGPEAPMEGFYLHHQVSVGMETDRIHSRGLRTCTADILRETAPGIPICVISGSWESGLASDRLCARPP